jgi:hypothetical protein
LKTRAELGEILHVLHELRELRAPAAPQELILAIVQAEALNLESRRVALNEVRRLVEGHLHRRS